MDHENHCLVIPDIHHKIERVQKIRAMHPGLPIVFLGDYFDDFEDTPWDMETTCEWLADAIRNEADSFLIGNHCFAYLSYELGVTWGYCSGWTRAKQQIFHRYFPHDSFLRHAKWLVKKQGWLLSHAGITNPLFKSFVTRKTGEDIDCWIEDAQNTLFGATGVRFAPSKECAKSWGTRPLKPCAARGKTSASTRTSTTTEFYSGFRFD